MSTKVVALKHGTFLIVSSNAISYINHSISQEHYTTGCLMNNGILNYINKCKSMVKNFGGVSPLSLTQKSVGHQL